MAEILQKSPKGRWEHLDKRDFPQHLFGRRRLGIGRLFHHQQHHLAEAESSAEPRLQMLHELDRDHHMGEKNR